MASATLTEPDLGLDDEDQPPPRRRRRLLLACALALPLLALAWWLLPGGDAEEPPPAREEGEIVEVAQMTVNLAGPQLHYARFSFAVVLDAGVEPAAVEGRFPLLKDAALTSVQHYTQERLRTPEGTAELRADLGARARALYPDGEVLRIVLTELVVQ